MGLDQNELTFEGETYFLGKKVLTSNYFVSGSIFSVLYVLIQFNFTYWLVIVFIIIPIL